MTPTRVFLDTNIYIVGASNPTSSEGQILRWAGLDGSEPQVQVVMSEDVLEQIRRVGRRLRGKDWAGALLSRMWRNLKLAYVAVSTEQITALIEAQPELPREDLTVYLTARNGAADCFVSYNHELIRALVSARSDFECLTPDEFAARYLVDN